MLAGMMSAMLETHFGIFLLMVMIRMMTTTHRETTPTARRSLQTIQIIGKPHWVGICSHASPRSARLSGGSLAGDWQPGIAFDAFIAFAWLFSPPLVSDVFHPITYSYRRARCCKGSRGEKRSTHFSPPVAFFVFFHLFASKRRNRRLASSRKLSTGFHRWMLHPLTVATNSKMSSAGAELFEWVHTASELPYWGVIVGSTVLFRVALAPLLINSIKQAEKMTVIKPLLDKLQAEFRMAGGTKNRDAQIVFQQKWKAIREEHNFSMLRQFAPVIAQLPIFLWFFSSIRSMLAHNPNVTAGGVLWFTDLSAMDPFLRLNLLTSIVMYASFKLGGT